MTDTHPSFLFLMSKCTRVRWKEKLMIIIWAALFLSLITMRDIDLLVHYSVYAHDTLVIYKHLLEIITICDYNIPSCKLFTSITSSTLIIKKNVCGLVTRHTAQRWIGRIQSIAILVSHCINGSTNPQFSILICVWMVSLHCFQRWKGKDHFGTEKTFFYYSQ